MTISAWAFFVPNAGFVLNNRGGGFTSGRNAFAPGKRPVHTLAPIMIERDEAIIDLSKLGVDGQVQGLLQVLLATVGRGEDLSEVVAAPCWRSEDGKLLVEAGHLARDTLAGLDHRIVDIPAGDTRFGAITAGGRKGETPFTLGDWRRTTWAGVA